MAKCIFCDQENPAGLSICGLCSAPLPASESAPLPDDVFRKELLRLLRTGQREPAVAAYRRRTGVALADAVEAIDVLEMDSQFDLNSASPDLEWEVIKFLERGEKIGAIRLYREKTNLGLNEAKDAVDAIEVRMGLAPVAGSRGGCMTMLLVLGLMVAAAVLSR